MQHLFNPRRWPLWPQNHQKQTMPREPYTGGEIQRSLSRQHPRKPAHFDLLSFWLWPPPSGDSRSTKLPKTGQEIGNPFSQKQWSKALSPASYIVSVLSSCLLTFSKSLTMCHHFQNCQAFYNVCKTTAQQIILIETILQHGWQTRKRSGLTHHCKHKYVNTWQRQRCQSQILSLHVGETRLKSDGTNGEKMGSYMMPGWGHFHILIHLFDHPSNHKLESSQQSQGAWQEYTSDRSAVYQRAHRDTDMCTEWQALNVLVIELWEETRVPEVNPQRWKKAAQTQQR